MTNKHPLQHLLLVICILAIGAFSLCTLSKLIPLNKEREQLINQDRDALYLPNVESIEFLSFGYTNVVADILWFKTISYFGKHYATDRNYPWLSHMCDLVTTLDPQAFNAYQFCSNMLSWEANTPNLSIELLTKAIKNNPDSWKMLYLRGFTQLFFLKNQEAAKEDFILASKLPGAHAVVKRLAAKQLISQDDPGTAVEFLESMLQNETDPTVRQALQEKLKDSLLALDIRNLKQAVSIYRSKFNKAPTDIKQLVDTGILQKLSNDPFGGSYYINKNQEIRSTTQDKKEAQAKNRKAHD